MISSVAQPSQPTALKSQPAPLAAQADEGSSDDEIPDIVDADADSDEA